MRLIPNDRPTIRAARSTSEGGLFLAATFALSMIVGGLQMFHVRGGLLTDYGADVFGTAWLYAMTRTGKTIIQRGRSLGDIPAALVVFVLCAAAEFGQRWHVVSGRFDPYDLVSYGATVALCVALDRAVGPFALDRGQGAVA